MRNKIEKIRMEAINAEAAEWLVRLRDDDPDYQTRAEFVAWLLRFPAHLQAYLEVSALWSDAQELRIGQDFDVDTLISEARQDDDIVVSLTDRSLNEWASRKRPEIWYGPRRHWLKILSATVAASLAILFFAVNGTAYFSSREYSTGTGEQLSFSLEDGSVVYLNTNSRLVVKAFDSVRRVTLLKGEAFFDVAPDSHRPFLVSSDDALIRVVGTKFNVQTDSSETTVTVAEGKVKVGKKDESGLADDGGDDHKPGRNAAKTSVVDLARGEQATVRKDLSDLDRRKIDIDQVMAWRERRLLFNSEALKDVIEEFNRYDPRYIDITDPSIGLIKISGVFNADDSDSLLDYLKKYEGVAVQVEKNGKRHLSLRKNWQ